MSEAANISKTNIDLVRIFAPRIAEQWDAFRKAGETFLGADYQSALQELILLAENMGLVVGETLVMTDREILNMLLSTAYFLGRKDGKHE